MNTYRFSKPGIYALDPQAFGIDLELVYAATRNQGFRLERDGAVAVVELCGPVAYAHPWLPTYSATVARVAEALAAAGHTVVLHVDSPGGDVAGAFDAARAIRKLADASGKRLVGYVDNRACSAGYALLSACHEISVSSTGQLGSVGVIFTMKSEAGADAAAGLQYALVTSGKRKGDGNPHLQLTEEAIEAAQASVDVMAAEFFGLVAEHRGIEDGGRSLEAGVFVGAGAVAVGLGNRVESYHDMLARVALAPVTSVPSLSMQAATTAVEASAMAKAEENKEEPEKKEDALRASLVTASQSDDEEKSKRAKRALKAYDEEEEEKKEDAKASAVTASLAAQVQTLSAELAALRARDEARAKADAEARAKAERDAFLATRPDLAPELVKSLEGLSLEAIKPIVEAVPVGKPRENTLVAKTEITRAAGEGSETATHSDPETAAWLDRHMGLVEYEAKTVSTPYKLSLGVITPKAK